MEPIGHGAIRFRHVGDLREHGAFPDEPIRAPAGVTAAGVEAVREGAAAFDSEREVRD